MTKRKALKERERELVSRADRPSGYVFEDTGQTFASQWAAANASDRRKILERAGVRIYVGRGDNLLAVGEALTSVISAPADLPEEWQNRFGVVELDEGDTGGFKLTMMWGADETLLQAMQATA